MITIFRPDTMGELMSHLNKIFIGKRAESLIEDGLLFIVPNIPPRPVASEISTWRTSDAKE